MSSENEVEAPAFCMYCGQKLRPTESGSVRPVMPDPSALFHQGHETMAFTPAEPSSVGSGQSGEGSPISEPSADASGLTITSIAGYALRRFLGAGGMGTVYEAEAQSSGQRVAIKLLSARLASNPSSVERFRQEGRVASQITHPRCVFVLRADTEMGRPFIIMELMPGQTLKDLIDQNGVMSHAEAVDRILDVIDGLIEAHRLGVIHRDVKPSNCFMTEDNRVKVGDFGLSKSLAPESDGDSSMEPGNKQLTSSGTFLGTVMYASPEQIRGEPVSYDSDVYAVCGTLYFLLTGRAPFQHESLTASLAKAVSEPPPAIRDRQPNVPKELERVVLKGLDRERSRRYHSLTELRDALVEVQVEKQQPARPRAIILAYLIDGLLLTLLALPLEIYRVTFMPTSMEGNTNVNLFGNSMLNGVISLLYFTIQEGVFGSTLGKRLLRLRVQKIGEVGPPGLLAAGLRSFVFIILWFLITSGALVGNALIGPLGGILGGVLGVVVLVALCFQFRRSRHGYRGIHDFAAGTRVIQRPRALHRSRLVSHFANPLERLQPTSGPLPPVVGSFSITGKLCDLPDGGEVWSGDDRSLGRRILLRILPPGISDNETLDFATETPRPTRLRTIAHGAYGVTTSDGNLERRAWLAYVAPAGAPLLDVVSPEEPLRWVDARPILEQLTDELVAQDAEDVYTPACLEQVWVEPGGRLQLLDFPLPSGRQGMLNPTATCPCLDPGQLIRQTTTLALEGVPRPDATRLYAPIPPHASKITDKLFIQEKAIDIGRVQTALRENHHSAPEVTGTVRAAHLSVLTLMVAIPLMVMYAVSGLYSLSIAMGNAGQTKSIRYLRETLTNEVTRQEFLQSLKEHDPLSVDSGKLRLALVGDELPKTLSLLERREEAWNDSEKAVLGTLNRPERYFVHSFEEATRDRPRPQSQRLYLTAVETLLSDGKPLSQRIPTIRRAFLFSAAVIILAFPLCWAVFSFVFRGGLSMQLAGITIVNNSGGRAARWRCFLRELVVWLPIVTALMATLCMQYEFPTWTFQRTGMWLIAILLLPLYLSIALREPARPPQDRLMGTHLVPE
ncbi:MAG: protein kinase domain-containing protein [Fimbriiglobus sp.]